MNKSYDIYNIEQISRLCFYAGLGIGFVGLFGIIMMFVFQISILETIPPCSFYVVTGYYCPGCGGTRALDALLHGEIVKSLYYHPFVVYIIAYYIMFEFSHILRVVTHGRIAGARFNPFFFYVGIVIVIVQCMTKNYLRFRYGFAL